MGLQTQEELRDVGEVPAFTVTTAARDPNTLAQLEREIAAGNAPALEGSGEGSDATGPTAQQVHDAIAAATNLTELGEAEALVDRVDEAQRSVLLDLVITRKDELSLP